MHDATPDIPIITGKRELEAFVEAIRHEPVVAVDLEADSMHHYREKVCLIQVSACRSALVDPLQLDDVSPLAPLLADPSVRKVFHGADYDIRCLHRDFGIEVNSLFDTMIACRFLGEKEFGLSAVLKNRFGVELDKSYQKADWSRRPLTPGMIAYAMEDTRLLVSLHDQLRAELQAKGRLEWVEEECEALTAVRHAQRGNEPFFLRFKGAHLLDPRSLAALEALLAFRDERARQRDLPPFKILPNEALLDLAVRKPRDLAELEGGGKLPQRLAERYGKGMLQVLKDVEEMPEESLPRYPFSPRPKKDPKREAQLKNLKQWREKKAADLGLEPGLVANNALLEALVDLGAARYDEGEKLMRRWQAQLFAGEPAAVLRRQG